METPHGGTATREERADDVNHGGRRLSAKGAAQDVGAEARERADDVKDVAADAARQFRDHFVQTADRTFAHGRSEIADHVSSLAAAFRSSSDDFRQHRHAGIAQLNERIADGVEHAAAYLRDSSTDTIVRDAKRAARNHPGLFYGAMFLTGAVAMRLLRSPDGWGADRTRGRSRSRPVARTGSRIETFAHDDGSAGIYETGTHHDDDHTALPARTETYSPSSSATGRNEEER